jgi:tetratricopeptide (TPR) repeat protein
MLYFRCDLYKYTNHNQFQAMRILILLVVFALMGNILFAQDKQAAENLVNEGIPFHDKGDYAGAITRYDKALALDKDNLLALTEKALTLLASQKYEESVRACQKALDTHRGEVGLRHLYVTYGNAMDELKESDKSIEKYDEGIKLFPDFYELYFNKGITLAKLSKDDEALLCFQKSILLNPTHPGSHNAMARVLNTQNKRIPSLLAFCRFFVVEPQSERAKANLANLSKILKGNVEQKGQKEVMINLSPALLADLKAKGKPKDDNFSIVEMILSMASALDIDEKYKNQTEVEQFIRKFKSVCSSLEESKKDNHGFCWEYYVPYFVEMNKQKFVDTFAHIAFATSVDAENKKWLDGHGGDISLFYEWSKAFAFKQLN